MSEESYEAYAGCEEWQETQEVSSYEEALSWLKLYVNGYGLYPTTEMWIENLKTQEKINIDPFELKHTND